MNGAQCFKGRRDLGDKQNPMKQLDFGKPLMGIQTALQEDHPGSFVKVGLNGTKSGDMETLGKCGKTEN